MTDTPDNQDSPSDGTDGTDHATKKWLAIAGAVVIVVAFVAALLLLDNSDETGDDTLTSDPGTSENVGTTAAGETTPASATTEAPATTAVSDTSTPDTSTPDTGTTDTSTADTSSPATVDTPTTQAPPLPDAVRPAIWPWVVTDTRYDDPVEAATGFATDFLGFDDPIAGEYTAGDSRSGEVELRAFDTGPATVVSVRQLTTDGSWWILGAASENITIDEPETGDEVASPLTVAGTARASEGTVDVELRADGNGEPIFESFVTGSGGLASGPYSESFEFTSPGPLGGALVVLSLSSEDGSTIEASALRVFYG